MKLFLGLLFASVITLNAQTPKVLEVKDAPKVKEVPKIKEAPKVPELKAPPKAPEVKTPPKVPTIKEPPKIPTIKQPPSVPKVPQVPKIQEPPKVPKVPVVQAPPKVPTVKEPPKAPKIVEVKQPPKVPVVKEAPRTPKIVEVKQPPKAPVVKDTPKIVETKQPPKVPVVKDTPKVVDMKEAPTVPTTQKAPQTTQIVDVQTPTQTTTVAKESPAAPNSTPSAPGRTTKATAERKAVAASTTTESTRRNAAKKPDEPAEQEEPIKNVLERARLREDDPAYYRQGGKLDDQRIARFIAEQDGSDEFLERALQGGKVNAETAVGRVRDVLILEEVVQGGGVDPDDPDAVRIRQDILEGKAGSLVDIRRKVNVVGNKAIDVLEGVAPRVNVKDLERKGDIARAKGNSKLAQRYYDQAIDAIKNGGETNSPQFRAQIIAEVNLGLRPAKDLAIVAVVQAPPATTSPNTPITSGPGVSPGLADVGVPRAPGFQAPEVTVAAVPAVAAAPGSANDAPSGPASAPSSPPEAPAPSQPAPAVDVASGRSPETSAPTNPNSTGPAAPGPAGNTGLVSNVESFPDGRTVETFTDARTGEVVRKEVTIWLSDGTVRLESYDANGNFIGGETLPVISVTPGGGGQTADASHRNPNTTTNNTANNSSGDANTGTSGASGGNNDASSNSSDDEDDSDNSSNDQPAPMTAAEQETVDDIENSQNSSETVVVTPRPPGFEKDRGTGMELSEATGGRMGRAEAQQALARLELKASGNGTAGPSNPADRTRASGVLLTPEEKGNAERALNMATGGGLINPVNDGNGPSIAVTDRDLKELQLKGNGGAKGPTDTPATPTTPPDPSSPFAGPGPIVGPAPRGANAATQNLQVAPNIQVAPNLSTEAVQQVRQGN